MTRWSNETQKTVAPIFDQNGNVPIKKHNIVIHNSKHNIVPIEKQGIPNKILKGFDIVMTIKIEKPLHYEESGAS